MNRMLIAALTAVCMVSSASAAMNRIEKSEQLRKIHKMYLQGVRDGLLAHNRQLATDTSGRGGSKPHFCLPPEFDLTIDKTEKLTSRKVNSAASNLEDGSGNFDERYDVSLSEIVVGQTKGDVSLQVIVYPIEQHGFQPMPATESRQQPGVRSD
jgi:hypothetical protein